MSKRKQPDEKQTVKNEADRKYFHQMLNMADDDLDPYQYRLLGHYLRWAGHNGDLPESFRDTAKVTRMSVNKVRSTQKELVDTGYITIKPPTIAERGAGISSVIHVVDRWAENVNRYAKAVSNLTQVDDGKKEAVSNLTQVTTESCVKYDTEAVSNLTHSEELLEEPLREEQKVTADAEPLSIIPPKKVDPLFDAIGLVWNSRAGGYIGKIKSLLLGRAKGNWKDSNFDPPATPEEVTAFGEWYKKRNPGIDMPGTGATIQKWFYQYRDSLQPSGPEKRDEHDLTPEQVAALPDMTPDDTKTIDELIERFSA